MTSFKNYLIGGCIAGVFLLGYGCSRFLSGHDRYLVRTYNDKPFVVDREAGEKQEIIEVNGSMQLGDLKYRLQGILEDDGLEACLQRAEKKVKKGQEESRKLFKQPLIEWKHDR
jgi:hypothetical protein